MQRVLTKKFWTEGWGSFAVAIGIALTIRWALMEAYVIPSASMLPSLLIHDHIFVNKLVYGVRVPFSENWLIKFSEPKRGEVIVFKYPENKSIFFIKRVVGVPGDHLRWDGDKLYINDQLIERTAPVSNAPYEALRDADFQEGPNKDDLKSNYDHYTEKLGDVPHSILLRKQRFIFDTPGEVTIPPGKLFVMGDNRDNSHDSRRWASGPFVPDEYILGRAMFVWLSCEDTLPVVNFLCNPLTIRWTRFFHNVK